VAIDGKTLRRSFDRGRAQGKPATKAPIRAPSRA